jgi:predicted TIM-barrel fold metal-dependent hydrolase
MKSDDMLLFSSDFPHWQFDGDDIMPAGIPEKLYGRIRRDNALATYGRLATAAA